MATFEEFYNSLPEDSNNRGELFEKVFIPWFLTTAPEWSSKINKIWLWSEYPQRWGQDCGIDLVFEDKEKRHWAVQSKCVSPDREISKAEIDSFLSESNDSRIYKRLLVASTNGIGKNAKQVIKRQEKKVVCILKEYFDESSVIFPSSLDDLTTGSAPEKRTPKRHQKEAINDVVNGLQNRDRGQLLMACGTGKTLTSLWIKEALKAKRVLVLLPSLSLLSQTWKEWSRQSQGEMNSLCVCSDKTVVKQDKSVDAWIEDASDHGVDVTSDPAEIRKFISENDSGVVFSTYQSSPLIVAAQSGSDVPIFDIAFADEAHRCAGKVSASFGSILDDHQIRASKRLFMTATPRVMTSLSRKKAADKDIEVACMDDTSLFGEVLHRLNFSKAIEHELLTDYRVLIIGVDDPTVHSKIINRELVSILQEVDTDTESLANHIALSQAMANSEYGLKRVITFHGRVKGAKKFAEIHQDVLDWLPEDSKSSKELKIGHVAGTMNSAQRNQAISQLRNVGDGELGILSNARCLSEGVDVPALNGVAFIEPKRSTVDIIQAVGRAIRKSDAKDYGYILLPVYLGDTSAIDDSILASRFKDIWDILLALKSQDDILRDFLDNMRVEIGKRGEYDEGWNGFEKIIFDLPERLSSSFAQSIRTLLVSLTTDNWDEMYGKLLAFVRREGHAKPRIDDPELGTWVNSQRQNYRKGILNKRRIELLEELLVYGWVWNAHEGRQEKWLNTIYAFLDKHGHVCIPEGDKEAGQIAKMIRQSYCGKQKYILDQETIDALNRLRDKGWMWDVNKEVFEEKVRFLHEWCTKNKSVTPPKTTICPGNARTYSTLTKSNEFNLGTFAAKIRTLYRLTLHRNNPEYKNDFSGATLKQRDLTSQEISLIENIPAWYWDSWDGYCRAYLECARRKITITSDTKVNFDLPELSEVGTWVTKMRGRAVSGKLKTHQVESIEALPGWTYEPFHDKFMEGIKRFAQYTKEKQVKNVPQSTILDDGYDLGGWVSKVRTKRKKGRLSKNPLYNKFYEKLLNSYGFAWDGRCAANKN